MPLCLEICLHCWNSLICQIPFISPNSETRVQDAVDESEVFVFTEILEGAVVEMNNISVLGNVEGLSGWSA